MLFSVEVCDNTADPGERGIVIFFSCAESICGRPSCSLFCFDRVDRLILASCRRAAAHTAFQIENKTVKIVNPRLNKPERQI